MATRILVRHDSAANFTSVNPVLMAGELGFEIDSRKIKAGTGVTPWRDLPYVVETPFTAEHLAKLNGIQAGAQVNAVTKVFGRTGDVVLQSGDVSADLIGDGTTNVAYTITERQKLAALAMGVPATRTVTGAGGVTGGGPLGDGDIVLSLAGMPTTPTANAYWGTNLAGVLGLHDLPPTIPSTTEIPWQAVGNSTSFTSMPAARTEWTSGKFRVWRDCTNVKHLRMSSIITTTATVGQFAFEYAPGELITQPADGDWVAVTDLENAVQATGYTSSDQIAIPPAAAGPCWWRLVGKNGDAAQSPAGRHITLWWDDSAAKGDKGDKGDPGDVGTGGGAGIGQINVMAAPYNAACDGTTDDTIAITTAATAIRNAGLGQVLNIPRKTRVGGTVNLLGVSIRAVGDIIMAPGSTITVGNSSAAPTPLTIELLGSVGDGVYTGRQETPYIRVIGKNLRVIVGRTPSMLLYADANAESSSTSYNDISVGHCKKLGIASVNSSASVGSIDENRIYCGRITYLDITSNYYRHNNNVINGGFEPYGTEPFSIVLDHCHSNQLHGRFNTGGLANSIACSITATNNRFTTNYHSLVSQVHEPFFFPSNWVGNGTLTDLGQNNSFRYLGFAEQYSAIGVGVTAAQSSTAAWTWMLNTGEYIRIAPGDVIAYHFPVGGNWRAHLAIFNDALAGLTPASGDVTTHLDVIAGALAWTAAPSGWEANSLVSGADITTMRTVIAVVKPGSTARWARISIRAGSAVGNSSSGARAVIYRRSDMAGVAPSQMIAPATQSLAGTLSPTDKAKIDSGTGGGGGGTGLPPAAQIISVSNTAITSTMVFCDPGCTALKLPLTAGGLHDITFMNRAGATVTVTSTSPETITGMTSIDIPNGSWLRMRRAAPNWYEAPLG